MKPKLITVMLDCDYAYEVEWPSGVSLPDPPDCGVYVYEEETCPEALDSDSLWDWFNMRDTPAPSAHLPPRRRLRRPPARRASSFAPARICGA